MKQSKKIAKIATVERIEYIIENVCRIPQERIEAAVNSMRSDEECIILMRRFSEYKREFAIESYELELHKELYNQQYSSDVNGLYGSTYIILDKARKQLFFMYILMNAFSKKPNQSNGFLQTVTDNIEFDARHSMIGHRPIPLRLFDMMNPVRRTLVCDITGFLHQLEENLSLCLEVINEENAIKADNKRLVYIFEKQTDEAFSYIKKAKKKRNTDASWYGDLLDYKKNPQALADYFHILSKDKFADLVIGIRDKKLADYSVLLRKAYAEDIKKMNMFRFVVANVDTAFSKLTGELLCYIYQYTGCEKSHNAFLRCFEEEYLRIGGKQKIVTPQALSGGFSASSKEGFQKVKSILDDLYLSRPVSTMVSESMSSTVRPQQ